ncbi:hypothetical protein ACFLYB_03435, partial [Chloroflexota bacterium]
TEVEISGEGLIPGEAIIVVYDGDEIDIESGDEEADTNGEFTLYIIIPESEYGEHTLTVIGEDSLAEFEEIFNVVPDISVNPASGEAGTIVTVTGTGFDRSNGVDFSFGGVSVTSVVWIVGILDRTNTDGTFVVDLTIPDIVPGTYIILAEDEDNSDIFDATFFTIEQTITPTPTPTPTITITTTITTTTTAEPTTVTLPPITTIVTTTAEPITVTPPPNVITATVTEEVTITPIPTTTTVTTTKDPTTVTLPPTTIVQTSEGSQINIWLPIVSALGAIILTIVVLVVYSNRQRGF